MNESQYFENFVGEGERYFEGEWYDDYAIVWGNDFIHATSIDKDWVEKEAERLKNLYPGDNVRLEHHHSDTPQRWNKRTFGWTYRRWNLERLYE